MEVKWQKRNERKPSLRAKEKRRGNPLLYFK